MIFFITKRICHFFTTILYRVKVNGKENIPKEGGALICPNHVHAMDSVSLVAHSKRRIYALAKEDFYKNKLIKWYAKTCGIYPIKQNSADIDAIKVSLKLLKEGKLLLIFPEGTRNGMAKGKPVKNGPMLIAIKAGVPIIPVGIKGEFKPFRKVTINIGKPIYYNDYKEKTKDKEVINELTKNLMSEIKDLRDK